MSLMSSRENSIFPVTSLLMPVHVPRVLHRYESVKLAACVLRRVSFPVLFAPHFSHAENWQPSKFPSGLPVEFQEPYLPTMMAHTWSRFLPAVPPACFFVPHRKIVLLAMPSIQFLVRCCKRSTKLPRMHRK